MKTDLGYEIYLVHRYTHDEPREGCLHCFPPPLMMAEADWDMLRRAKFR